MRKGERDVLDPWIEGYLSYCGEVRRLNPRTLVDMRCSLKRVAQRMAVRRPQVALWKLPLEDYLHWVEEEREAGMSVKAIIKMVCHVRGLLDYAWRSGRSERNVLDGFKLQDAGSRSVPDALSYEEARALVAACSSRTVQERRDRIIVLLLYGCGLRTFELCALDVKDVDREQQELFVAKGKGGMQRRIPVPDGVWSGLLAYLCDRKGKRGALFRTEARNTRIRSVDVSDAVSAAAQRGGLKRKITPKVLRHTFATHLMDRGVDLGVIASLMGHRSPQETGVYLHVLPGKKEDAVARLNGPKGDSQ